MKRTLLFLAAALIAAVLSARVVPVARADSPRLRVLTTTTDLRELAREVGGADITVSCLTKGPEDPHFLEARPSFVRLAAEADVLVVTGLELEIGYEPLLLGDSRNGRIQRGKPGYVDCAKGIDVLDVPSGVVDRSLGDVHGAGNPHYLLDPGRAKVAAGNIADAFSQLAPDRADAFAKRLGDFRRRVDVAMFGEKLLAAQPGERLERRLQDGTLLEFLRQRRLEGELGGHAALMAHRAGAKVATYHATFRYLLDRFHLEEAAKLEPKPGVPPTPRHLADVIERMRAERMPAVLYAVYQPQRTAESVAASAGAVAVRLAHQPDALPGTPTYVDTLRTNVEALARALGSRVDPR